MLVLNYKAVRGLEHSACQLRSFFHAVLPVPLPAEVRQYVFSGGPSTLLLPLASTLLSFRHQAKYFFLFGLLMEELKQPFKL